MYSIEYTGQFKRSLKLCRKRGLPLEELHEAISLLERDGKLPAQYKPHKLTGNYAGQLCRDMGMPHQAGLASALAAK